METTELGFYLTQDCTRKGEVDPEHLTYEPGQTGDLWGNRCHDQEHLRAHREVGTFSTPRKHTGVSWMKLFGLKLGQANKLEKRKPVPPIYTGCFPPSVLPFLASSVFHTHLKYAFPS